MRRGTTPAAVAVVVVTSVIGSTAANAADPAVEAALGANAGVHDTADALVWDAGAETAIGLTGASATVTGPGASADGGTVTITAPGTYRVRGTLADGALVVASPGDGVVRVVLDGASITSATTSPLQVLDADEVVVVLADGTTNRLTDPATYVFPEGQDEPNATLFSAADLTIAGGGALTVVGNANDGIASKDGLVVAGGTLSVTAADDGIRGKDYLVVTGGTLDVTAGGDGLKSDDDTPEAGFVHVAGGTTRITSGDDGITAASDVIVSHGDLAVTSGGGVAGTGDGSKGLVGDVSVVVGGGSVVVDASDDAVHSDGTITFADGNATLAAVEDGVDAGERLVVTGGALTVTTSSEGLESKVVEISGGLIGVTATDDAINASDPAAPDSVGAIPGVVVTISGGLIVLRAATGDGLDSNGSASITGGTLVVDGPTEFINSAVDVNGTFPITGGTVIGVSSSGLVGTPTASSPQTWVSLASEQPAGTLLHVLAPDGAVLASFRTTKASGNLLFSHASLQVGAQYRLAVGGSADSPTTGGYHATPGDASGATVVATATAATAPGGGWGGWPPR
ncbi:carbohydrate-binding domain-containing protein [Cellulomonas sp. S1-8]|uniref:carbohydrate-binding domain-containing protein n=1 Tax=Cellulomonas sp. S1-8 TaxID=2904790 RepID=UPI0022433C8F|nr:carbohydrate-binding domain-containing protein [Cellulomonas sp. S1-8]UZN04524.1 carbohydrate-binding domain-containing protein [Cellulomonas sp. S1-8]